jgi:hypothetical protein
MMPSVLLVKIVPLSTSTETTIWLAPPKVSRISLCNWM